MKVKHLLEAAIYGPDLNALERFYIDIFGLEPVARTEGRNSVLRCGFSALILFNPTASTQPGGMFPPHGTTGAGHIAFVVPEQELPDWRTRLAEHNIPIEKEISWKDGGVSLYVRDPAGNSVELAPPTIWRGLGQQSLDHGI